MARLRRHSACLLILLLALGIGAALAQEPAPGLYARPVLALDPGLHTAPIRRLDADAAGRFLVTASHDKTVRVWAAEDGRLLRTIRLPAGPGDLGKAYAVAISPDGQTIATGGWTGTPEAGVSVYLFESASGRLLGRVGGLPDVVHHLAFSPDGRRLAATLGGGKGVRLLDAKGLAVTAEDTDYGSDSYGAAWSPDGTRLAATSYDGQLRLYDAGLKRLRLIEAPGGKQPFALAFSPDGTRLAVVYGGSQIVDVLDAATLAPLFRPKTRGIGNGSLSSVAWSADGAFLLAGGRWDVSGQYPVRRWAEGGRGAYRDLELSRNTLMSLRPLPGGRVAFAAQDPALGVLGPAGEVLWRKDPATADLRGQEDVLAVSGDGAEVAFGYGYGGRDPARFTLRGRRLTQGGTGEGLTRVGTSSPGLEVTGWKDRSDPALNGRRLLLRNYEISRSLAIAPDGQRFALGTEWYLRLFDRAGAQVWQRPVPSVVSAVTITADGRLLVAGYADGTIRWHRLSDGEELLAFLPLADRSNWVAWTPDGFYAATPDAYGVVRWHVNRGWDEAGESIPISDIPQLRRPDVLPLVLQEEDIVRALGLADLASARRAVQARTRSVVAPGAQLHVLAVGVSAYNEAHARQLRLAYADKDAWAVASALLNTQGSLYAQVRPQVLRDGEATRAGIMDALDVMRKGMAAGTGRDLAVVHFSGHGAVIDGRLYLLPFDVDTSTPSRIKGSALSAEAFRDELSELGKLGRVLVLLDTCHSGAVAGDGAAVSADATLLRAALASANVTVLTSSSGTETSREDPAWGHGAFTKALLDALGTAADGNHDGLVNVAELMGYLAREVPRLTEGAQTPGVEARFEGGLFAAGL